MWRSMADDARKISNDSVISGSIRRHVSSVAKKQHRGSGNVAAWRIIM